jgi:tight adherence protein C
MLELAAGWIATVDSRLLLTLLVAAAAMVTVAGVAGLIGARDPIEQRLAGEGKGVDGGRPLTVRLDGNDHRLKRFARWLTPADARERGAMRERLGRAGYRGAAALRVYFFSRAALGLGFAVLTAVVLPLARPSGDPMMVIVFTVAAGLLGYVLPVWWVARRIQQREGEIRDGFPDTLDMLLVCIEAGQGLDAALARVAVEVERAHPVLAEELALVGHELRAGKERPLVLRDFARRSGVEDVSAFVTVLIQSDQFGTSIGDALRVYASEMRNKRLMRAEEKANTLPVKLALATMVFTVPPVMLILIGPSIIMVMRSLARFMG